MFLKSVLLVGLVIYILSNTNGVDARTFDYKAALTKSLLYFEGQRSGKLPPNQRVQWRGDSGLNDGKDVNLDLIGGYYVAGDNVKFGYPLVFTITMLSWSVVEYAPQLDSTNELTNALNAIKWGTDYLIKTHKRTSKEIYGQVGNGDSDHDCWERPEDMDTPRRSFILKHDKPGSDIAGEAAAAFAAASIALNSIDPEYAKELRLHASALYRFAKKYKGLYHDNIPEAGKYYPSSGYWDEFLWAAAWLYRATSDRGYLGYINNTVHKDAGGPRTEFSWDDKFVGAYTIIAKVLLDQKVNNEEPWTSYKSLVENFICSCLQQNVNNIKKTPGGLLWFSYYNNLQYTATATFIATVYSDHLASKNASMECHDGTVRPRKILSMVKSQLNYILGANPNDMSYMVGYGSNYPKQIHHRASSIVSIKEDPTLVTCKGGYDLWYDKNKPNPNVLDGAVVGGPDENDKFTDTRSNFQQNQPTTVTVAPLVGVLARFAA